LEQATGRFWRSALDQNLPGSGLGLAIAADLMETLGGRVALDSPAGGGLRVSLCLPADGAAALPAEAGVPDV
ncbi:ATP-binding protein, partial [Leucobacter sp. M11]|uniref:ATP-binding protein n=1 Tax=Leucobacter sp. M11 TaxID=2993565 RepID=UPI002D808F00